MFAGVLLTAGAHWCVAYAAAVVLVAWCAGGGARVRPFVAALAAR